MKAPTRSVVPVVAIVVLVALIVFGDRSVCPAAGILGVPCPSCGLSRASMALLRGDWRRAHAIHPLVVPVLVFLATASVVTWGELGWSRRPWLRVLLSALGVALVIGMTLLWAARFRGLFGGPVEVRPWRF
jgi:hypothetical protein